MSRIDIVRAWKDKAYRDSLTEAERAQLPECPCGSVELSDAELEAIEGKAGSCCSKTHHCAFGFNLMASVLPSPILYQSYTLR